MRCVGPCAPRVRAPGRWEGTAQQPSCVAPHGVPLSWALQCCVFCTRGRRPCAIQGRHGRCRRRHMRAAAAHLVDDARLHDRLHVAAHRDILRLLLRKLDLCERARPGLSGQSGPAAMEAGRPARPAAAAQALRQAMQINESWRGSAVAETSMAAPTAVLAWPCLLLPAASVPKCPRLCRNASHLHHKAVAARQRRRRPTAGFGGRAGGARKGGSPQGAARGERSHLAATNVLGRGKRASWALSPPCLGCGQSPVVPVTIRVAVVRTSLLCRFPVAAVP